MAIQRLATIDDIDALVAFRMIYLREVAPGMSKEQEASVIALNKAYLQNDLNRECFVSITVEPERNAPDADKCSDGRILSCAYMTLHKRAANFWLPFNTAAELYGVYTLPEARRRGYVVAEIDQLCRVARENGVERITLNASDAGVNLYKKIGFQEAHKASIPMYLDLNEKTEEKQRKVIDLLKSRIRKNTYTQDSRRDLADCGFSDCSSLIRWAFRAVLDKDIGVNTEAQLLSPYGREIRLRIILGIPDFRKLQPGDCLFFRGNNESRTCGVGHVEVYMGRGRLIGHGYGVGPRVKNLIFYCLRRYFRPSASKKLKNQGLIAVRRYL